MTQLPTAKRYTYRTTRRGDTVKARHIAISRNCIPETDFVVRVQFKDSSDAIVQDFTPVVVDNTFTIPAFVMNVVGKLKYDVEFTYPDGTIQTYLFGDLKIVKDVTNNG